jgi:hypothetical protein
VGYRYAAESVGFMGGIVLVLRHLENRVTEKDTGAGSAYAETSYEDKNALKRRIMTSLHPGLELGWAF